MKVSSSSIGSPSSVMESAADPPPEILSWLKSLPLAPEFHPTLAEFQDPISYILKIEPQASKFGMCKIIPPLQPSPKKTVFSHLGRSFAAAHPQKTPVFPTRHQEIGLCPRRSRPALKTVWESGESYTLQQFELKSKQFEKTHLKKSGRKGPVALEEETQFWKATADRPFTVECASGIPGSGFAPASSKRRRESSEEALTVADTEWNMRVVSRAKGSLVGFVHEEVAGVTSPVVDVGMAFSWFAWQVEELDLHGLSYLHFGAEKTWYGVPMDAAAAFEEVVRVQGYGGEVNPLVTFATLCEKTTVMSPEVLIGAGVPCCRLLQNAGEFVVTFPRAYHAGFSHGFNCGESATIATPEWLRIAKDASIRRAAINCPASHSHVQLLHALAMTLCSRTPIGLINEPRSSRLKDKKRGEGDVMVKELFVRNVMENNDLLHSLLEEGSCVLISSNYLEMNFYSKLYNKSQRKENSKLSLGLRNPKDAAEVSEILHSDDIMSCQNSWFRRQNGLCSAKGKLVSLFQEGTRSVTKYSQYGSNDSHTSTAGICSVNGGKEPTSIGGSLFDRGQLLCVTCGIQCFPCMAIIQPKETAAMHLILNDPNSFNGVNGHPGRNGDVNYVAGRATEYSDMDICSGQLLKDVKDHLANTHGWFNRCQIQSGDQRGRPASNSVSNGISSLDLLAVAYGDPSDSEEELVRSNTYGKADDISFVSGREDPELKNAGAEILDHPSCNSSKEISAQISGHIRASEDFQRITADEHPQPMNFSSRGDTDGRLIESMRFGNMEMAAKNPKTPFFQISDSIASKAHIFCLEHAVEVVQFLQSIGGANVLLLCHHDYPKIEEEAKKLAEELAMDHVWNNTTFREANKDENERVSCALDYQEAIPSTGDWTVKLGINFHYSTSLSRSPLSSKVMPYNSVICKAFGLHSLCDSVAILNVSGKRPGRQKKIFVAGRWCGKVWMSNQVHPYLAYRDTEEQENIKLHLNIPKPNLRFDGDLAVDTQRMLPKRESSAVETEKGKTGKKRRKSFEKSATKKPKFAQSIDIPRPAENSPEKTSPKHGRVLRSRLVKCGIPSQPADLKKSINQKGLNSEVEGGRSMSLRRRPVNQQELKAKSEVTDTKSKREVRKTKLTGERELKTPLKKRTSSINAKVKKDEGAGHLYKKTFATESQVKKKNMKKGDSNKNVRVKEEKEVEYQCDIEGCSMSFSTKRELSMHKQNICLVKGCGKKLFSHKYMAQHQRVHLDFRPLKCPWKGCRMTFKWAWARTEHMRVHTGARPYQCAEPGCGQTFRFVSDFSRHRRKTGHAVRKKRSKG